MYMTFQIWQAWLFDLEASLAFGHTMLLGWARSSHLTCNFLEQFQEIKGVFVGSWIPWTYTVPRGRGLNAHQHCFEHTYDVPAEFSSWQMDEFGTSFQFKNAGIWNKNLTNERQSGWLQARSLLERTSTMTVAAQLMEVPGLVSASPQSDLWRSVSSGAMYHYVIKPVSWVTRLTVLMMNHYIYP